VGGTGTNRDRILHLAKLARHIDKLAKELRSRVDPAAPSAFNNCWEVQPSPHAAVRYTWVQPPDENPPPNETSQQSSHVPRSRVGTGICEVSD
jgi:hypothetical protein